MNTVGFCCSQCNANEDADSGKSIHEIFRMNAVYFLFVQLFEVSELTFILIVLESSHTSLKIVGRRFNNYIRISVVERRSPSQYASYFRIRRTL